MNADSCQVIAVCLRTAYFDIHRNAVTMDIKVGSSKTNSHDLARVSIHMQEDDAGNRTFALALDGLVVRSAVMTKDKKFYHRDTKAA